MFGSFSSSVLLLISTLYCKHIVYRSIPGLGDFCPSIDELSATVMAQTEDTTASLTECCSFLKGLGLMPSTNLPGQNFSLFHKIALLITSRINIRGNKIGVFCPPISVPLYL